MYKFNIGSLVNHKRFPKATLVVLARSIHNDEYKYLVRLAEAKSSNKVFWLAEHKLESAKPHCPVCNQEIEIDAKERIEAHGYGNNICFGSYMCTNLT